MVNIRAFRGITYDPRKNDVTSLLAPPYDVMSPEEIRMFKDKSRFNIAHLTNPSESPRDDKIDNKYVRSTYLWGIWRSHHEGFIQQASKPSIYLLEETFVHNGQEYTRPSIITQIQVEDLDQSILDHEETNPEPVEDRLQLAEATGASFDQIMMLYSDPSKLGTSDPGFIYNSLKMNIRNKEVFNVNFGDSTSLRMWQIDEIATIRLFEMLMKDKRLIIADGHHRYQAALANRDKNGNEWRSVMLMNEDHASTIIGPYHRIVKVGNIDQAKGLIKSHFSITGCDGGAIYDEFLPTHPGAIGFFSKGARYIATLEDKSLLDGIPESQHNVGAVICNALLDKIGIPESELSYVHESLEASREIEYGGSSFALFVNPPTMKEVRTIVEAGYKMPRKSTFFTPKPLSGVVIEPLETYK